MGTHGQHEEEEEEHEVPAAPARSSTHVPSRQDVSAEETVTGLEEDEKACRKTSANASRLSVASRGSVASSETQCFYIGDDDDLEEIYKSFDKLKGSPAKDT